MPTPPNAQWLVRIYRDDSLTPVIYTEVKHLFWTCNNTVLVIAQYNTIGIGHHYINWPRERFCWYQIERSV